MRPPQSRSKGFLRLFEVLTNLLLLCDLLSVMYDKHCHLEAGVRMDPEGIFYPQPFLSFEILQDDKFIILGSTLR